MSSRTAQVVAVIALAAAIVGGFAVRHRGQQRRNVELWGAQFEPGVSKAAVLAQLGRPDVELSGPAINQATSLRPPCADAAVRLLRYLPRGTNGAFVEIYFDQADRVVCVHHGFVHV